MGRQTSLLHSLVRCLPSPFKATLVPHRDSEANATAAACAFSFRSAPLRTVYFLSTRYIYVGLPEERISNVYFTEPSLLAPMWRANRFHVSPLAEILYLYLSFGRSRYMGYAFKLGKSFSFWLHILFPFYLFPILHRMRDEKLLPQCRRERDERTFAFFPFPTLAPLVTSVHCPHLFLPPRRKSPRLCGEMSSLFSVFPALHSLSYSYLVHGCLALIPTKYSLAMYSKSFGLMSNCTVPCNLLVFVLLFVDTL